MTPLLATTDDATAGSDGGGFEWGLTLIRVPDVGPVRLRPTPAEDLDAWRRAMEAQRDALRAMVP